MSARGCSAVSSSPQCTLALLLGLVVAVSSGCSERETTDPGAELDHSITFKWVDEGSPPDQASDAAECRARLRTDPWVQAQKPFNRSIVGMGCMEKKGWLWLTEPGGAPGIGG